LITSERPSEKKEQLGMTQSHVISEVLKQYRSWRNLNTTKKIEISKKWTI